MVRMLSQTGQMRAGAEIVSKFFLNATERVPV